MGTCYRFAYCLKCNSRLSRRLTGGDKPGRCPKCGQDDFRFSDWYIGYHAFGRTREEKIGGLDLAKRVLRQRENEIAEGKFRLRHEKRILFRDFALGDYWNIYVETQLTVSTKRDYRNRLNQHILPAFGDMWIHQVSRRDVESWIAKLKHSLSDASINRFIALLKSIYTRANILGITDHNPAREISQFREENQRVRYLSREEYKRLIEAAGNDLLRGAIALAVGTGLRRANLFNLKWSQVDLKKKMIRIEKGTKRKRVIEIPISGPVYDVLNSLPRGLHSDYVLHKPLSGGRFVDMHGGFERAVKVAGIEDFTWHDLRHTFASWFVMSGGNLYALQEILGHSTTKMTQRYAHLAPDFKAGEMRKMESFFEDDSGCTADEVKK